MSVHSAFVKRADEVVVGEWINIDGVAREVYHVAPPAMGHVLVTWRAGGVEIKARHYRIDHPIEYMSAEQVALEDAVFDGME